MAKKATAENIEVAPQQKAVVQAKKYQHLNTKIEIIIYLQVNHL